MKSWILGVFALLAIVLSAGFTSHDIQQRQAEEAAVTETINLYFEGILAYDADKLRRAFHPEAHIMGSFSNGVYDRTFETWMTRMTETQPPADVSGYTNTIVSIDIAGNAATVKTDLQWPTTHYIDYLNLLKINDEWKIVNKVFHAERP